MSTVVLIYLLAGVGFSEMANIGHGRRYGRPMSPWIYLAGVFAWFPMFLIGRK